MYLYILILFTATCYNIMQVLVVLHFAVVALLCTYSFVLVLLYDISLKALSF